MLAKQEKAISAVVEHFNRKVKEFVARNLDFFKKVATFVAMKRSLYAKKVQQQKGACEIVAIVL